MLRWCFLLILVSTGNLQASECLQPDKVRVLDNQYEEALRVGDVKFLQGLLADEFVWVHNLSVDIETKPVLLARLKEQEETPKARKTSEVSFHRFKDTTVLSGLSSVDKYNSDGKSYRTSRYRFMRTYVADGKDCKLLSSQTMKVWSNEKNLN